MNLKYENVSHVRRLDYFEDFGTIGSLLFILFIVLWILSCIVLIRRLITRQRMIREISQNNPNGAIALVGDGRVITVIPVSGEVVQGVAYQVPVNNPNTSPYYPQNQPQVPYEEEPTYLNPTIAEMPPKESDIVSINP